MRHTEGLFDNGCPGGLFYQEWSPESSPAGIVILVHGLAEHSSRYLPIARRLVEAGFAIYTYDQRGHGRSQGQRCYVNDFSELTDDLDRFIRWVRERQPSLPVFLIGHSMGALEAVDYLSHEPAGIAGAVISGIPLRVEASLPRILVRLAGLFSALVPRAGIRKLPSGTISRDSLVVNDYVNDPLVYTGRIPARMGYEVITTVRRVKKRLRLIQAPMLILHGGADRLADPAGSQELYDAATSSSRELYILPECYHEVYNEFCRDEVLDVVIRWMETKTSPLGVAEAV